MKITTLYIPQNNLLWWVWQSITGTEQSYSINGKRIDNFLIGWSVYPSNGQVICFKGVVSKLCIIESSEIAENYSDAYSQILSVAEREGLVDTRYKGIAGMMTYWVNARPDFINVVENEKLGISNKKYRYKVIDFDKYIKDSLFYNTRCVGGPIIGRKITTVKKHEGKWQIELEGASKKTVTFILDENYEVLDVWGKAVEGPRIWETEQDQQA